MSGIISLVHLTGSIKLWNYIHRENIDSHIHIVHLTYKYSITKYLFNILLEVVRENRLAALELELQSTSSELQSICNSGKLKSLAIFYALFIHKVITMQENIDLIRAQVKPLLSSLSQLFRVVGTGCLVWGNWSEYP